jgi:hypothetical protein
MGYRLVCLEGGSGRVSDSAHHFHFFHLTRPPIISLRPGSSGLVEGAKIPGTKFACSLVGLPTRPSMLMRLILTRGDGKAPSPSLKRTSPGLMRIAISWNPIHASHLRLKKGRRSAEDFRGELCSMCPAVRTLARLLPLRMSTKGSSSGG